ncbi:hypothetical protein PUN28_020914 [Cardiocondyla obscurior]|uniref:Uncharacterized protein n=1 Tax=Cardiocondyla obscurior TaxID=286306 RepID=A0AAW2E9C4_9HYME
MHGNLTPCASVSVLLNLLSLELSIQAYYTVTLIVLLFSDLINPLLVYLFLLYVLLEICIVAYLSVVHLLNYKCFFSLGKRNLKLLVKLMLSKFTDGTSSIRAIFTSPHSSRESARFPDFENFAENYQLKFGLRKLFPRMFVNRFLKFFTYFSCLSFLSI